MNLRVDDTPFYNLGIGQNEPVKSIVLMSKQFDYGI
jgi:hypothetical protein